jgi:hypothetical protein
LNVIFIEIESPLQITGGLVQGSLAP